MDARVIGYAPPDIPGPPNPNDIPYCPPVVGDLVQDAATGFVQCVTRALGPTGAESGWVAPVLVVIGCAIALGVVFLLANRNRNGRPRT